MIIVLDMSVYLRKNKRKKTYLSRSKVADCFLLPITGWEIYEFYMDDGYSAKSLDHPAMQRLMNRKRIIRYYICYSQDGSTPYMVKDPECRCSYKQTETIDNYVVNQLMQYSVSPKLARQAVKEMLDSSNDPHNPKLLVQAKKELAGIKKNKQAPGQACIIAVM